MRTPLNFIGRGISIALLVFHLALGRAPGQIIPTDRMISWANDCGVPGGIPNRTTIFTTLNPGATTAQINTAIANCPANQVVKLNAGTYNVGEIQFRTKSNITLRGAGPGQTIINSSAGSACITSDQYGFATGVSIVSGYTKGSTSIVLSNATGFTVGNLMLLDQNDDTTFVFSANGPERHVSFITRITGVNGNTVTFSPSLPWGFSSNLAPRAARQNGGPGLSLSGIEDMTINNNGGANDIFYLWGAYACWAKNVEMVRGQNSFVFYVQSLQCEVRHCYIHDAANAPNNSDGFGVYLYESTTYCRIEDNIFSTMFVGMWQTKSSANAYLYNYCRNGVAQGFVHQLGIMNAGHGAHPMMCLWEGNIGEQWQHDGYHGSASHQTLFRNWIHGLSVYNDNRKMIDLTRGSYYYNVVGNVLGDASWSGPGTFNYEMVGEPGYDEQSVIYRLGYPNVANNGLQPGDIGSPWPYAITYPDVRTKNTLLRHGNYDWKNRAIVWDPAIADHTIPNSLFYASKPAYFGSCPWPAFDPAAPSNAKVENIPAGYRYIHGVDPPTGPVNQPPIVAAGATPTSGPPPLAVAFSSAGSSDPESQPLTYSWNFGDGSALSTVANPSHTYTTAGAYIARLTVSDGVNSTISNPINIAVGNQPPVATANATPRSGAPPLAVAFSSAGSSDPEGTPLTYSWNFGDGSPVSTAANPNHTYAAIGSYTARLTVSDGTNSTVSPDIVISVTNSLVAAYGFDTGTGTSAVDASGNSNTGTLSGATWTNSGRFGRALVFDGVNAVVNVPHSASLNLSAAMTLEGWLYPTTINNDYQSIISKPLDSTFNSVAYVLHGASRPNGFPSTAVSSSATNLFGLAQLPLNTWSHVAATYDGATLRLYVNGAAVSSQATSGPIAPSTEAVRLGLGWAGRIDEVRIYNRALTAAEVQADMNSSINAAPAPPTGLRVVGP